MNQTEIRNNHINVPAIANSDIDIDIEKGPKSVPKIDEIKCKICLSPSVDAATMECGHSFWQLCILTYFRVAILDKQGIKCPNWTVNLSEGSFLHLLSDDLLEKYLSFQEQMKVDRDPSLHWCPQTNCGKYVEIPGSRPGKKMKAKCEWGFVFCIGCHSEWHGCWRSCRSTKDSGLRRFQHRSEVRRCPKCKTTIQKQEGWNHMTCHVCQYEFCWLWGKKYTGNHFERASFCSSEGSISRNVWSVLALLPLILWLGPLALGYAGIYLCFFKSRVAKRKSNDERNRRVYPSKWWNAMGIILFIILILPLLAIGIALEGLLPILYLIALVVLLVFMIKWLRFKYS